MKMLTLIIVLLVGCNRMPILPQPCDAAELTPTPTIVPWVGPAYSVTITSAPSATSSYVSAYLGIPGNTGYVNYSGNEVLPWGIGFDAADGLQYYFGAILSNGGSLGASPVTVELYKNGILIAQSTTCQCTNNISGDTNIYMVIYLEE